jgi:hypothetical protein
MIVFKPDRFGRGQHGGLGYFEQSFLMMTGDRQEAGAPRADAVSIVDLAPTVPHHLQLPGVGMNGSPIQITRQVPPVSAPNNRRKKCLLTPWTRRSYAAFTDA